MKPGFVVGEFDEMKKETNRSSQDVNGDPKTPIARTKTEEVLL